MALQEDSDWTIKIYHVSDKTISIFIASSNLLISNYCRSVDVYMYIVSLVAVSFRVNLDRGKTLTNVQIESLLCDWRWNQFFRVHDVASIYKSMQHRCKSFKLIEFLIFESIVFFIFLANKSRRCKDKFWHCLFVWLLVCLFNWFVAYFPYDLLKWKMFY